MSAEAKSVAARFGDNLRFHRRRAGMSQERLGEHAELHRTEIGLLERGARVPRIDTLIKLANALSVPPGEFLVGISWKPANSPGGGFEVRPRGAVKA